MLTHSSESKNSKELDVQIDALIEKHKTNKYTDENFNKRYATTQAFFESIRNNMHEIAVELLCRGNVDLNARPYPGKRLWDSNTGPTALEYTPASVIEAFLQHATPDVLNAEDPVYGTPLYLAVVDSLEHVVQFLKHAKTAGIDVNKKTRGETPWHVAVSTSTGMTQLFLQYADTANIDLRATDRHGRNALEIAAFENQLETTRLLLESRIFSQTEVEKTLNALRNKEESASKARFAEFENQLQALNHPYVDHPFYPENRPKFKEVKINPIPQQIINLLSMYWMMKLEKPQVQTTETLTNATTTTFAMK